MYCKQWRDCAICRKWRAKQLRDEMLNSTDPETLGWGGSYHRMKKFDNEQEAKPFIKSLDGKDNYRREPQPNGEILIFFANDFDLLDENQPGEKVTPENIHIICLTVEGSVIAIVPLSIVVSKGRIFNLKTLQFIGNVASRSLYRYRHDSSLSN